MIAMTEPSTAPTVDDLSARLRVSRRTIQNAFLAVTQTKPNAYLKSIRLNQVRASLINTTLRTRFGLRLRAVGENAHMVDAAGVSVARMRYAALTLNGKLCGLAGSYLVLAQNAAFVPNMTAGRGFIALAALIFGKWHPVQSFWACLLFGFLDAVAIRLQGVRVPVVGQVPVELNQALPYLLTVILLAGFIGRTVAPRALGQPYLKER